MPLKRVPYRTLRTLLRRELQAEEERQRAAAVS
jgi:hypothetical protein